MGRLAEDREAALDEAVRMVKGGAKFADVAEYLGCSVGNAYSLVSRRIMREHAVHASASRRKAQLPQQPERPAGGPWWVLRPREREAREEAPSDVRPCPNCGREMAFLHDCDHMALTCTWCGIRTPLRRTEAECDSSLAIGELVRCMDGGGGNEFEQVRITSFTFPRQEWRFI